MRLAFRVMRLAFRVMRLMFRVMRLGFRISVSVRVGVGSQRFNE